MDHRVPYRGIQSCTEGRYQYGTVSQEVATMVFCCYNRSPQNISRECSGVAEVHPLFLFLPLPPPLLSFSPPALLLIPLLSLPSFPPSLPPSPPPAVYQHSLKHYRRGIHIQELKLERFALPSLLHLPPTTVILP